MPHMVPLLEPRERIRATALGASSYSMQLSGDTIYLSSHARLLPRRNLPVVRPFIDLSGAIEPAALGAAIRAQRALLGSPDGEVAVALPWSGDPSHVRLRALAEGIVAGFADRIAAGMPLYVMTEGDIGRSLGASCAANSAWPATCWSSTGYRSAISIVSISAASACPPVACR